MALAMAVEFLVGLGMVLIDDYRQAAILLSPPHINALVAKRSPKATFGTLRGTRCHPCESRNLCMTSLTKSIASQVLKSVFRRPDTQKSVCFIAATRLTESDFWSTSPLGRSLPSLLKDPRVTTSIAYNNSRGLPEIYNEAIATQEADLLVFLHDDVWLVDEDLLHSIREASKAFDVIGVAGNTRRTADQPAWIFSHIDGNRFVRDTKNLSGTLMHGSPENHRIDEYGPSPAPCESLDGVFLAVDRRALSRARVKFDTAFSFDLYDMDFCRSARKADMKLGTWPIKIIHESVGVFGSERWKETFKTYLEKWRGGLDPSQIKFKVFQIVYNEATKESRDPGFLPMNNLDNPRPDWSEYWPIRKHLLKGIPEDEYQGFLSPKFFIKTKLTSTDVENFLRTTDPDVDVIAFSPFFDLSAAYINVFHQAVTSHPGIEEAIKRAFQIINPSIDVTTLVTHSQNTIFCNYFVANRRFWNRWLMCCEEIFELSENIGTKDSELFNTAVTHSMDSYAAKVFIIERVATFLLATEPDQWKVRCYDPLKLPTSASRLNEFPEELLQMDALKLAYDRTHAEGYLSVFHSTQAALSKKISARFTATSPD